MAEAGVKIAKLILKKNQDPSLGLLEYRSTPLENGYSPAELLMGRKLRTTLPIAPENLNPKLVDSQTLKRKEGRRRKDMKSRYDRRCGATDMEELSEGDTVWITDMRTWGIVKKKASTPRSYMVDTPVGTLRRNRFHLRKGYAVQYPADPSTPTFSGEELVENEKTPVVDYPSNDSEDGQIRTRSGRIVKPCTISRADWQIVRMAVTVRSVTSRTVAQHIQSVTHHPVSARTIRRRLQQSEWNEVVITDESRFCLQHHDGRIRVWRHRERMLNSCVMHRHTGPAPGIMIQIHPQLPQQINFGNVWKLLGLLYPKNTSKVFESMPRRVAAVISNNVGYSGY
ncbi:hypothetical protein LAZ67_19002333 [Cordylochernes scorpioides]|uniref:Transposase Tc1-like domain-containing protein n=1 Tax=Cordylochernes scorpioides TaxID=51811 RepID=A0ABY6LIL0_9ARAC|nr:hypothetical protein LAZ67_19002333 [Cordylochernes scorpioides]